MAFMESVDSVHKALNTELEERIANHPKLSQRYIDFVKGYYIAGHGESLMQARYYVLTSLTILSKKKKQNTHTVGGQFPQRVGGGAPELLSAKGTSGGYPAVTTVWIPPEKPQAEQWGMNSKTQFSTL